MGNSTDIFQPGVLESALGGYLPLIGGTLSGKLIVPASLPGAIQFGSPVAVTGIDGDSNGMSFRVSNQRIIKFEPSQLYIDGRGGPATLRMGEDRANGSDFIDISAPDSLTAPYGLTLPVDAPTDGWILGHTTGGQLVWIDPATVAAGYLPLTGGTLSGNVTLRSPVAHFVLDSNAATSSHLWFKEGSANRGLLLYDAGSDRFTLRTYDPADGTTITSQLHLYKDYIESTTEHRGPATTAASDDNSFITKLWAETNLGGGAAYDDVPIWQAVNLNTAKVTGADRVLKEGDIMSGALEVVVPNAASRVKIDSTGTGNTAGVEFKNDGVFTGIMYAQKSDNSLRIRKFDIADESLVGELAIAADGAVTSLKKVYSAELTAPADLPSTLTTKSYVETLVYADTVEPSLDEVASCNTGIGYERVLSGTLTLPVDGKYKLSWRYEWNTSADTTAIEAYINGPAAVGQVSQHIDTIHNSGSTGDSVKNLTSAATEVSQNGFKSVHSGFAVMDLTAGGTEFSMDYRIRVGDTGQVCVFRPLICVELMTRA